MSAYQRLINAPGFEPRHVEAYLRLEYGTLDHLSLDQFKNAVLVACELIDVEGFENAELLAKSYGL